MSIHPLILKIEELAKGLQLDVQNKTAWSVSIWTSPYLGIQLRIEINDKNLFTFFFTQRTSSWFYDGERTDLHDSLSLIFAAYLKKLEFCSCDLIDVANPVTGSDVEIYSRYLIPMQINEKLTGYKDTTKLEELIISLAGFEQYIWNCFEGCPCDGCRKKLGYEFSYRWEEIPKKKIEGITKIFGDSNDINYCERTLPTWFYYRNFKLNITLLESKFLIPFMSGLAKYDYDSLAGIKGEVLISGDFRHFFGTNIKRKVKSYFKRLNGLNFKLIFLESKLIAVGQKYILTFDIDCGINSFKFEKERIHQRHQEEFQKLFAPQQFIWSEKIDEALFEDLIKDLLEREPRVLRVRKTSHTYERDGGTDLIAEWSIPKNSTEVDPAGQAPAYKKINVIVQCKAYTNGVGKKEVVDIRDTVDYRDYQGYFLVVSSYTKKSLSDYLDKLRVSGKIWVDWWTRTEIEDRLKKNEDLIAKYKKIVQEQSL